nr:tyrosine--tRNA ligase [Alphaproteobacteria bacterium]
MGQIKSPLLNVLQERGYIHQATDLEGLDQRLCTSMVSAYMGFDATSNSLHIGNLVGIMMLRHLQHFGHRPVVLLGGGTTKIGDPSGKDESRKLLSATDIQHNTQQISKIFYQFLDVGSQKNQAAIVNNAEWLDPLKYIDFL